MKRNVQERADEILKMDIDENYEKIEQAYRELLESSEPESFQILLVLLSSGDVIHTQKAADVLALKRDPKYLPEIRRIREKLPERKGLRDYRWTVDRAIEILENVRRGSKCRCALYKFQSGFSERFNPSVEQSEGFVSIVREVVHRDKYFTEYFCRCNMCARRWRVIDEIGYHYPLYAWEEITDRREYDAYFENSD
ncbi:MAG: hypothetical protein KIH08_04415 [Candidatus Freyarchaeota archaeon]|nr:hypothetical protein [Candidatus Jordarchaeia archaeon]MBS7267494.1 hypothetical protein [Candidatus Jordarchaeia archaeon]MBS7280056.1 hypothetical protein [Candidatus Jordarchaeia archaeon]